MTRRDLRVGVIGLGALGLPMAANLRRAGLPLRVHTRSRSPEHDPSLQGSIACATPAEAAEGVDVLLVCVSDNAAVEAVLFGANGASGQLAVAGAIVEQSTTTLPSVS